MQDLHGDLAALGMDGVGDDTVVIGLVLGRQNRRRSGPDRPSDWARCRR
jgi:hypothetical protein